MRPDPPVRLTADTKADQVRTAEYAARLGWRFHSEKEGSVRCVLCGEWIRTARLVIQCEWETWENALVGAMVLHLQDLCLVAQGSPSA